MRFRVLAEARGDLKEIFAYWAERAGMPAADRLIEAITEQFWLLGEFPRAGKAASEIASGMRCFPAGEYLIYYRISRITVDIIYIFHGSRDQPRAFRSAKRRS